MSTGSISLTLPW